MDLRAIKQTLPTGVITTELRASAHLTSFILQPLAEDEEKREKRENSLLDGTRNSLVFQKSDTLWWQNKESSKDDNTWHLTLPLGYGRVSRKWKVRLKEDAARNIIHINHRKRVLIYISLALFHVLYLKGFIKEELIGIVWCLCFCYVCYISYFLTIIMLTILSLLTIKK